MCDRPTLFLGDEFGDEGVEDVETEQEFEAGSEQEPEKGSESGFEGLGTGSVGVPQLSEKGSEQHPQQHADGGKNHPENHPDDGAPGGSFAAAGAFQDEGREEVVGQENDQGDGCHNQHKGIAEGGVSAPSAEPQAEVCQREAWQCRQHGADDGDKERYEGEYYQEDVHSSNKNGL